MGNRCMRSKCMGSRCIADAWAADAWAADAWAAGAWAAGAWAGAWAADAWGAGAWADTWAADAWAADAWGAGAWADAWAADAWAAGAWAVAWGADAWAADAWAADAWGPGASQVHGQQMHGEQEGEENTRTLIHVVQPVRHHVHRGAHERARHLAAVHACVAPAVDAVCDTHAERAVPPLAKEVGVLPSVTKALAVDTLGRLVNDLFGQRDRHAGGGDAHRLHVGSRRDRQVGRQQIALAGACVCGGVVKAWVWSEGRSAGCGASRRQVGRADCQAASRTGERKEGWCGRRPASSHVATL
eukprot:364670-Chlamydomonas_euryale.AAC.5